MLTYARVSAALLLLAAAAALFIFQHSEPPLKRRLGRSAETYNPQLAWVDNLSKAEAVTWSLVEKQQGTRDERTVKGIDEFVRQRFLHGGAVSHARENWLLSTLAFGRPGIDTPVDPDAILLHRHALCAQQSIVFMALLKRFGMESAAVRFSWPNKVVSDRGHFALAAKVDGVWRYFDSDLEAAASPPIAAIINGTAIKATYPGTRWYVPYMMYAASHGTIWMDSVNTHPGPRGLLLERVTGVLSRATPLLLAVLAMVLLILPARRRSNYLVRWTKSA